MARLDAESPRREGEPVVLAIDPARLQLFDAATGARQSWNPIVGRAAPIDG